MEYYKIIHTESGELMCYGKTPEGSINFVCDVLGEGYHAETISKEEYERKTEEVVRNCCDCIHNDFCNVDGYIEAEDCTFYQNKADFVSVRELVEKLEKEIIEVDISTGFGSEHYKEVVPWEKIKELTEGKEHGKSSEN